MGAEWGLLNVCSALNPIQKMILLLEKASVPDDLARIITGGSGFGLIGGIGEHGTYGIYAASRPPSTT